MKAKNSLLTILLVLAATVCYAVHPQPSRLINFQDYSTPDKVWAEVEPHMEQFYNLSPYSYCAGDPINLVDPTGNAPVYSMDGSFLGTDDEGLEGSYLIMDEESFTQGMSHKSAHEISYRGSITDEVRQRIWDHHSELVERPDYDGFVTIDEGIEWARQHPNAISNPTPDNTMYIDTSKLDFGSLSTSDFKEEGVKTHVNLFARNFKVIFNSLLTVERRGTAYALGNVNMILLNRAAREVKIVNDAATDYDWNAGGGLFRNTLVMLERTRTGLNDTHGFKVYYYGIGKLRK